MWKSSRGTRLVGVTPNLSCGTGRVEPIECCGTGLLVEWNTQLVELVSRLMDTACGTCRVEYEAGGTCILSNGVELVSAAKSTNKTQHGINDCYMKEVFI